MAKLIAIRDYALANKRPLLIGAVIGLLLGILF